MLRQIIIALLVAVFPSVVQAGPKEDAQAVFDQFLASFTAANESDVVALFAPDCLFWGTSMQDVATTPGEIRRYFGNAFGTPARTPGTVKASSLETSALVLSDNAVLVSGMWQVERVVDGQPRRTPLRVSLVVAKRGDRWQIAQFHNSLVPESR